MKSVVMCLGVLLAAAASAQTVRFETSQGNIDVVLLPESAPLTVANFLRYVNRGAYTNSFVHRSVSGFIWQGGGFTFNNGQPAEIQADPPVRNEYRISNTRGTIAMAKLGTDPNSATSQWFFNLSDSNASNLNSQNGGFTVFGRVDRASLPVMDRIAAIPVANLGSPFDSIPIVNLRGTTVTADNLVMIRSITVLNPAIGSNSIISASNFGGGAVAARGSYIEIYGSNLAATTRGWATADFTEGRAPTALEGVSVTIGGKPAFVNYISPGQVNVQVPADADLGVAVPVVVTARGQASDPVNLEIRERRPGLLAPAAFKVGDKQFVAALHATNNAFVGNGAIPNVGNVPAVAGETLTLYGVGFGPVGDGVPFAGYLAQGQTTVSAPVEFEIAGVRAQTTYSGLAPNLVGVYQFNLVVPANLPSGDQPLRVAVDGQPIEQTLYLPVQ